ncbi:MAG: YhjD/YihY/BrkB family envelope integrity protein [Acidimicrobiales bacterium]
MTTADWAEENVPWWWLVREGWDRYWRLNAPVLAGHIAFRTFVFLLPVAFLLVAVAGFLRSTGTDPQDVGSSLGLGQAIGQSMRQAGQDSQEAWYHVAWVAGAGLIMGSLGLASGLHYVYLQLWQMPFQKPAGKARATLEMGGGFIAILLVAVVAHALRSRGLLAGTAGVALLGLVGFGGFLGLGIALPRRASEWRWLIPGSVLGAAGVVGLQVFAAVYLPSRLASFSQTYGAFGIAATFIFYLYLIGQLLVLSVVVNAVWFDHYRPDEAPPPAADAARSPDH